MCGPENVLGAGGGDSRDLVQCGCEGYHPCILGVEMTPEHMFLGTRTGTGDGVAWGVWLLRSWQITPLEHMGSLVT